MSAAPDATPEYRATWLRVDFQISGEITLSGLKCDVNTFDDPSDWFFDFDDEVNSRLVNGARAEISERIAPYIDHFSKIGLIRADLTFADVLNAGQGENDREPTFYLVASILSQPEAALDIGEKVYILKSVPGLTLTLRTQCEAVALDTIFKVLKAKDRDAKSDLSWPGSESTEKFPQPNEDQMAWAARVCVSAERVERLVARWKRSGEDPVIFPHCGTAEDRQGSVPPIEWLVPGLIPRGCVTLLVGTNMSGKSTMLAELAAVVDSDQPGSREFLGVTVDVRCMPVTVSGEDPESIAAARAKVYQDVHGLGFGFWIDGSARPWRETLSLLSAIPDPGLIIVDPVRAFMDGNEDSSGVVSLFYDDLTALAREKNCAVIAAHHLSKGTPRSLANVQMMVRGSGVHTD